MFHSVDGLAVEVSELDPTLPHAQRYDQAAERLRADYPQLIIKRSAAINSDGWIFWCESV
jgi:hypothetical protein